MYIALIYSLFSIRIVRHNDKNRENNYKVNFWLKRQHVSMQGSVILLNFEKKFYTFDGFSGLYIYLLFNTMRLVSLRNVLLLKIHALKPPSNFVYTSPKCNVCKTVLMRRYWSFKMSQILFIFIEFLYAICNAILH